MAAQTASLIPSDQLIPVHEQQIGDSVVHVCRASDLHQFLRVQSRLADWIRVRIRKYLFVENQDFVLASENPEASWGGQNKRDYLLTLDMAKELSMVENNEQGRAARRYFILCEKQALASHAPQADRDQLHAIQTAYLDWSEAAAVEIQRLQGNVPPPPAALKDPAAALAALAHVLSSHRYLLTFSADLRAQLTPIAPGALMIPPGDLPNTIATPGSPIPRNLMPDIIRAAAGRL
ncbi:antA/AntB antirepressor family protein [Chitinolyticbacter meiyuanensis]|uniref:antA/AntB antirepressor family protein n=1 Tax=Chitinolyticbacter meiyuanensis TaxID=682798 RepID=UPI001C9E6D47|nr:antA/AntB antirepressor family protein [Chitinolyticbacter meiyuanensis]